MAEAFVIDATLIVDHFRGSADAMEFLNPLLAKRSALLHPVVHAELLVGARDRRHLASIEFALSVFKMCAIRNTDMSAALHLVRSHTLTHGVGWPDCLIAATCLRIGVPIVTTNDKHFKPIRGLRVIRPY